MSVIRRLFVGQIAVSLCTFCLCSKLNTDDLYRNLCRSDLSDYIASVIVLRVTPALERVAILAGVLGQIPDEIPDQNICNNTFKLWFVLMMMVN